MLVELLYSFLNGFLVAFGAFWGIVAGLFILGLGSMIQRGKDELTVDEMIKRDMEKYNKK